MAYDNRRRNNRFPCAVPVDGKKGSPLGQIATVDFSKGGIGFISRSNLPLNKSIAIELDLTEDESPILVIGKVKWVRHLANSAFYRIGLAFDDFINGSKAPLIRYFAVKK